MDKITKRESISEQIFTVLVSDFGDFLGPIKIGEEVTEYGMVRNAAVFTEDGRKFCAKTKNKEDLPYLLWCEVASAWLDDLSVDHGTMDKPKTKLRNFKVTLDLSDCHPKHHRKRPSERKIMSMASGIPEKEADIRWMLAFKYQWEKRHGYDGGAD